MNPIFDFDTTCVEVGASTSVQVEQKCDFELPTKLVRSVFATLRQLVGKCRFENSAQVGQNFF